MQLVICATRQLAQLALAVAMLMALSFPLTASGNDSAYEEAQASIQAKNWRDAISRLEALRRRMPEHAGALLDLAILYCHSGDKEKADAALDSLERMFALPAPIKALAQELRLRDCSTPHEGWQWSANVALGHDTNANQGSSTRSFTLGSSLSPLYLTLDDASLPQASTFAAIHAELSHQDSAQSRLYGSLRALHYTSASSLDEAVVLVGRKQTLSSGPWGITTDLNTSVRSLDGALYQHALSAGVQMLAPEADRAGVPVGVDVRSVYAHYPGRAMFDSWETAIALPAFWRLSERISTRVSLGWLFDRAMKDRPGGDRTGPTLGVEWLYHQTHDSRWYAAWQARFLTGESAYSPPLLDMTQRQRRHLLSLAWERKLSSSSLLRMEYQYTHNTDSIPMYRFDNNSIALYWVREGGH